MGRKRAARQTGMTVPGWAWWLPCVFAPVVLLNLAVAWFGSSFVSPLSFSFLQAKAGAVRAYLAHRPSCWMEGHAPLEPIIDAAERRHGLPPGLLRALVQVESESRVHRISPAGAMGPGQLMPGTAAMMGVKDPFDPEPAIDGSARYLAGQLRRFKDVRLAVAAYNAGPGSVNGRVPKNGETEYYVPKVLAAWELTRPPPPPQRKAPVVTKPAAKPKQAAPARPKAPASAAKDAKKSAVPTAKSQG